MFDFIMIMLEIPEMRNSVFPEIVSPLNSFLSKNSEKKINLRQIFEFSTFSKYKKEQFPRKYGTLRM